MIKIPASLKRGDKVAIISTARKISKEEVAYAKTYLEENDFEVCFGEHLFSEDHQYAGTDAERAADLQWALDDDSVKAVLCARGGYGTMRIIDQIDFSKFKENPKWVCGFSDVTVLHSHIHQQCQVQTLHCAMPVTITFESLEDNTSLVNGLKGLAIPCHAGPNKNNKLGTALAPVVGGNLSILYALSGSQSDVDTTGKILMIEEVDEYLYHIDRMLLQMKRAGKLSKLKGLVVGSFTKIHDNTIPFGKTVEEIVLDHCKEYDFPIAFDFPFGHDDVNFALMLGRMSMLIVHEDVVILK